jgi:hypothetical protein
MYEQYTQGLLGDKDDVLKKLPGGQTYDVEMLTLEIDA